MPIFYIDPGADCGRIGPFWWFNGNHAAHEAIGLVGTTSDPSRHLVWREGGCGFYGRRPIGNPLHWRIIQTLN